MSKKILITLPYSYSYRNIVLTGILEQLLKNECYVKIVLPKAICNEPPIIELKERFPLQLTVAELIRPKSKSIDNLIFTICAALMQKIQGSYSYQIKRNNSKFLGWKSYAKLSLLPKFLPKSKRLFFLLRWILIKGLKNKEVSKSIREFSPDLVFVTLNNKINEYFYLADCYRVGIQTISLVHSWDVITTKGSFIIPTDSVMVWNKINEMEYKFFVDSFFEVNSNLKKVGIPQFDIYKDQINKTSLTSVKEKLNIPINKEIVVYTTAVKRLYPNEKLIIKQLIRDFEGGKFPGKFLYIKKAIQEK